MSGLEFIGLALALAPLFTDAIEHHNNLLMPFKALNPEKYKEWAEDFLGDLNFEICMLKISLQKLIKELFIRDDLKAKLLDLENFDRILWREPEPELKEALDSRLKDCADGFVKSLTTILRYLDKIVKDDTLPVPMRQEEILVPETTSFRRLEQLMTGKGEKLAKRFRFGSKQDKRQKLLVKVGKHNSRLQRMLEQTSDVAPATTAPIRTRSSSIPHLHLWNCMDGFRKVMRTLCGQCDHHVRFGLLKSTGLHEDSVSFDMLMKFAHDQSGGTFKWGESKIHIGTEEKKTHHVAFGDGEDQFAMDLMFRKNSLTRTISGSTVVSTPPPTPLSSSPPSYDSPSIVIESPEVDKKSSSLPKRTAVTSICETIKRGLHQKVCSYLVYDNDTLWHTPTSRRQEIDEAHPSVTLEALLGDSKKSSMKMKQKKILSVVLASSLLWYPWQDHEVNKGSIHFHSRSGYDLTKPYTELVADEKSMAEDIDAPFRIFQNRSLLALAILLLEIELGQKIEAYYLEDDLTDGEPNANTDFFTASRLLQENSDEFYHGTREAIEACLDCEFGSESAALDDPDFRQAAYERIILPLEDVLHRGFNVKIEELGVCEQQLPTEPKPKSVSNLPTQPVSVETNSGTSFGMKSIFQKSNKPSTRNLATVNDLTGLGGAQKMNETPRRQARFMTA